MNCDQFRDLIVSGQWRTGSLARRLTMLRHRTGCQHCQEWYAIEKAKEGPATESQKAEINKLIEKDNKELLG